MKHDITTSFYSFSLQKLVEITGHHFKNTVLLQRAFTHSSSQDIGIGDYERLEFLGDRVLGLVIAEMLYKYFPSSTEGELSIRLNGLVCAETCAQIAIETKLVDMVRLGTDMKMLDEHRYLINIYADIVEALIAVLYLEGGLLVVYPFIYRYWGKRVIKSENQKRDAKTELQIWAHRKGYIHPVYHIISRSGPDHAPLFEVRVDVEGITSSTGKGQSKKHAEQSAATNLLLREGVWKKSIKK